MSIIVDKIDQATGRYVAGSAQVRKADPKKDRQSLYQPTAIEKDCINSILKDFRNGWQTMHLPRPEFNDYSLYQRYIVDMLAFNTYQENDGNPLMEDRIGGWQSQAMRPIMRNAAITMAANQTARQLVPKVYAFDNDNNEYEEDAKVMCYLVDWAREQAQYPFKALYRNIAALYSPISWGLSEYVNVYRNVKDGRNADGTWNYKRILDEDESGFQHIPISCDQVYFANFFERDCQKQDFIIIRRIVSLEKAQGMFPMGQYPNMAFVQGGIINVMDDANNGIYQIYDPHMRQEDVEVIYRWRKSTDSKDIMINGILVSEAFAPNVRIDHQYPIDCFYYLPINERCIAGKSLVFSMQSDARLANEFYQMIADGTKLNVFPPTVTTGSDKAGIDVIVPGLNLAFSESDVQLNTLKTADSTSLATAMQTLAKIEASLQESAPMPPQAMNPGGGTPSSAYEISRIEQNSATVLGLAIKFFTFSHVIPYGKLLISDILQYLTMPDAEKIEGNQGLVYKTFFANEPGKSGKRNKIVFSGDLPDTMTDDQKNQMSWAILKAQGGMKSNMTLYVVNPRIFRDRKFKFAVDADVLNPRSAELERAFSIELYDRAVAHPEIFKANEIGKILLGTEPSTSRNPDKYLVPPPTPGQQQMGPGGQPMPGQPQPGGQQPPQAPGIGANPQTGQPGVGSAPKPAPPTQGNQLPQKFGR